MPSAGHYPGCPCCAGPRAWSRLIDSLPHNPVKSGWCIPRRTVKEEDSRGLKSDYDTSDLSIEAIMSGETKSPIRLQDFRAFLTSERRDCQLAAVEFLEELKRYRALFISIPLAEQPLHPYAALDHLSLTRSTPSPSRTKYDQQPRNTSQVAPSPSSPLKSSFGPEASSPSRPLPATLAPQPLRPLAAAPQKLDVSSHPLYPHLQMIIMRFLQLDSTTTIVPLIPRHILDLALSETKLTTHPSTIERLGPYCVDFLTAHSLVPFLNCAVRNLGQRTSRGRLFVSIITFLIAAGLTAWLVFWEKTRETREWRLCLTPLYMLSIGYAIGSRTGLCFWLAWRGTREAMWFEHQERAGYPDTYRLNPGFTPTSAGFGGLARFASTRSDGVATVATPSPSFITFNHPDEGFITRTRRFFGRNSFNPSTPSLIEKGLLGHTGIRPIPPPPRSFIQVIRDAFSRRRSPAYHATHLKNRNRTSIASDPSFDCFPPSPVPHSGAWAFQMRQMLGAASTIGKVEDERIKKIQLKIAAQVALGLVAATTATMLIVWFIPCPRMLQMM